IFVIITGKKLGKNRGFQIRKYFAVQFKCLFNIQTLETLICVTNDNDDEAFSGINL
ncbi:hypothetical protein ACJX0J_039592, partial [Zea mays]